MRIEELWVTQEGEQGRVGPGGQSDRRNGVKIKEESTDGCLLYMGRNRQRQTVRQSQTETDRQDRLTDRQDKLTDKIDTQDRTGRAGRR